MLSPIPVSLLKELIQLLVIVALVFQLPKSKLNNLDVYFLLFLTYFLFHIVTLNDIGLWVDGIRYQLGYMIIGVLIVVNRAYMVRLDKIAAIIFFISIPVVLIAIVEFFDSGVIEALYGESKYMLNHTELALGERLISTFVNPINLGVFLTVSYASAFYMYKESKVNVLVFSLFSAALFFVITFTFSRIAIISFCIMSIYFFLISGSNIKRVILLLFLLTLIYSLSFDVFSLSILSEFNVDLILERLTNISSADTYTENARVKNWGVALQNIDSVLFSLWGLGVGFINPTVERGGIVVENMFISILIEFGIIGLLLYLSYFFYLVKASLNLNGNEKYFACGFLIVFLVCGMGNDLNRNFPFVFYFWIISASIILTYKKEKCSG
ncbi:hypothetical protein AMS58_07610 [Pseudoalteromonas porphyrae]|nr:hypothetical protein AMS58_07610 [Pseudoalteromonas porphyrae]